MAKPQSSRSTVINRRRVAVVAASLLVAGLAAAPAAAFEGEAFDAVKFEAYQSAGKPILIEVHAGWCPVCWKQGPILTELLKKPDLKDFVRITVEFDMEKDVLKLFKATRQSTIIVFKGKTETGRSIGDTNPASIEKLLRTAL